MFVKIPQKQLRWYFLINLLWRFFNLFRKSHDSLKFAIWTFNRLIIRLIIIKFCLDWSLRQNYTFLPKLSGCLSIERYRLLRIDNWIFERREFAAYQCVLFELFDEFSFWSKSQISKQLSFFTFCSLKIWSTFCNWSLKQMLIWDCLIILLIQFSKMSWESSWRSWRFISFSFLYFPFKYFFNHSLKLILLFWLQ